MRFTYESYRDLINRLKEKGYYFSNYSSYNDFEKVVIIRHDVDEDVDKAYRLAQIEAEEGISSTFFILVSSPFYNVFEKKTRDMIKRIIALGHNIGLHFDEKNYLKEQIDNIDEFNRLVEFEGSILESVVGVKINSVSMHRPSENTLKNNYVFDKYTNTYSKEFFENFKYLSDSRMNWREDIDGIIDSEEYNRLHILVHAFWYDNCERKINQVLKNFINKARMDRINSLNDNITNLEQLLGDKL